MNKLCSFVKKHKDFLLYMGFGALTTLVSFSVYFLFQDVLGYSVVLSNTISWLCAVTVAFLTNKPFVFGSHDWSLKVTLPEMYKFYGGRFFSGVFETFFLKLTVETLGLHSMLMKVIASVVVIIANYVVSKLFVFRKKNEGD